MNRYNINGLHYQDAETPRQAAIKHSVRTVRSAYGNRGEILDVLLVKYASCGPIGSYRIKMGVRADPRLYSARQAKDKHTHHTTRYSWLRIKDEGPVTQQTLKERES